MKVINSIPDHDYTEQTKEKKMPIPLMNLLDSMELDTIKSCVARAYDTPNIKKLSQDTPVAYRRAVKMMLAKMSWSLNVKEGLKPEQMNVIPSLLLSDYWHLTLNDINMVCLGIMTGKYKIFERIDTQVFFDCIRQYDASDERITAREQYHQKQHTNKQEAAETFKHLPQETQELFCKRKELKPMLKPTEIPPMAFKITDKDSVKKLRTDE